MSVPWPDHPVCTGHLHCHWATAWHCILTHGIPANITIPYPHRFFVISVKYWRKLLTLLATFMAIYTRRHELKRVVGVFPKKLPGITKRRRRKPFFENIFIYIFFFYQLCDLRCQVSCVMCRMSPVTCHMSQPPTATSTGF